MQIILIALVASFSLATRPVLIQKKSQEYKEYGFIPWTPESLTEKERETSFFNFEDEPEFLIIEDQWGTSEPQEEQEENEDETHPLIFELELEESKLEPKKELESMLKAVFSLKQSESSKSTKSSESYSLSSKRKN